jgi:RNA repair pathway DNA polymerase beta family
MNHDVVKIKFGSHLYGTTTPTSDMDFKSVFIPTREEILLQRVPGSRTKGPAKVGDGVKNQPGDIDFESYSLSRYLALLMDGQTVAIDMLFAPESHQEYTSPTWRYVYDNRKRFLTKKSAAFLGYCRQQANKYGIKGSRVAAAKEASMLFKEELILRGNTAKVAEIPEAILRTIEGEHTTFEMLPMSSKPGDLGMFINCCGRKVSYTSSIKQAAEVFTRIYENYGDRAKQAESNQGVDWKALSHAVRVGHEALELLYTGNVTLPLPPKSQQLVLAIKQGKLEYQAVADIIEELLERVELASVESDLREVPDYEFADELVLQVHDAVVRGVTLV